MQESIWGRCHDREVAKGPQVCLPTSKHHPGGPGQASKMGRGPDHDHTLLIRLQLVPRDHAPSNRATKKVQTIPVASMECNTPKSNSKVHESIQLTAWRLTLASVLSGIREEIAWKVTDSWTKGTKHNYQWMFEQWYSFCHKRGLPVLKICVSNVVEYLDYLQMTHDYAYMTLCMHASAICNKLQPTEQTRASIVPLVKQLLIGMFRKKPPTRVWDVKQVLNLLHALGEPWVLNYNHLTLKTVMILALATVNRPSDLNLLRISPRAMQLMEDSVTFQPVFAAKMPGQTTHMVHYNTEAGRGWMPVPSENSKWIVM